MFQVTYFLIIAPLVLKHMQMHSFTTSRSMQSGKTIIFKLCVHMIKHKAHKPTRYAKMQNQYTTNQVVMLYQLPTLEVKISEFQQKPAIKSRSIAKGHSVSA